MDEERERKNLGKVSPNAVSELDQVNARALEKLKEHHLTGEPYVIFLYHEHDDVSKYHIDTIGGGAMTPQIYSYFLHGCLSALADMFLGQGLTVRE